MPETDATCSSCGGEAVIEREYEGRALCREHFSRDVSSKVKASIRERDMVESGDRIAVALSGGKDSAVMLDQLVEIFGERPDIEIFAVGVHEGIDPYRSESLSAAEELCDELEVELEIGRYDEEYDLRMEDVAGSGEQGNCTYCGIMRRDLLNRIARENGADNLAVGHNLDDEAQQVLMNTVRGDTRRLAQMTSYPASHQKFVPRIKPLRDVREKEVALYSQIHDLGVIDRCPHVEEGSLRPMVKSFLNRLEEEMPGAKNKVVSHGRRLSEVVRESDEIEYNEGELRECDSCGEPCSSEVCRKCRLLEELRERPADPSQ